MAVAGFIHDRTRKRHSLLALLETLCIAAFAAAHLFIGRMRWLDTVPRSRWLSFAGGVAAAYIFLHVLPELTEHHRTLSESGLGGPVREHLVYLVALSGLVVFYGLERAIKASRGDRRADDAEEPSQPGVFWIHLASFALYNVLIGYLLVHREERGAWSLLIYGVAMALHFLTNDFGLRQDYRHRYDGLGRWVLVAAIAGGWILGLATAVPASAVGLLFAFLAGGVVMNVMKEELPEERKSRFLPFLAGAAVYAGLLLVI